MVSASITASSAASAAGAAAVLAVAENSGRSSKPRAGEMRVRLVATGICHTDLHEHPGRHSPQPIVLGHEGAGVVETLGEGVRGFAVGDHVILSGNSCGRCPSCLANRPTYCDLAMPLCFGAKRLDDIRHIERTLKHCVEVAGATLLHIHLHHFTPNGGVSGVAVLSESHISIHSWPEADYAALDVFMCGNAKPHLTIDVLRESFGAREVRVREHRRGEDLDEVKWQAAATKKAPRRIRTDKRAKAA